jgi:hypothetical protein
LLPIGEQHEKKPHLVVKYQLAELMANHQLDSVTVRSPIYHTLDSLRPIAILGPKTPPN